jgi:hypothetical protein
MQQPADEGVLAAHVGEDGAYLFARHHDRQAPGCTCAHRMVQAFEFTPENRAIEEEPRREGLVLCGGRYLPIAGSASADAMPEDPLSDGTGILYRVDPATGETCRDDPEGSKKIPRR